METPYSPFSAEEPPRSDAPRPTRRRRGGWPRDLADPERDELLLEVARRASPTVEFFVFALLSGLILSLGFLFDHPALIVASALVGAGMAPVVGLSFAAAAGSLRFFTRVAAGLLVGFALTAGATSLAAWLAGSQFGLGLFGSQSLSQSSLDAVDFLFVVGAGALTALFLVHYPQAVLAPAAALAYELLPPLGAAGFGLAGAYAPMWQGGLQVFAIHLSGGVLAGLVVFLLIGIRPPNSSRRLPLGFSASWLMAGMLTLLILAGNLWGAILLLPETQPQPPVLPTPWVSPTAPTAAATWTPTPQPSATREPLASTGTPRHTSTATLSPTASHTPTATPVLAVIITDEGSGALLRDAPEGGVIALLPEGTLVEILGGPEQVGEHRWWQVRTPSALIGWLAEIVMATATPPAP